MPEEKNNGMIYEGIIPGSVTVGGPGIDLLILVADGNWKSYRPTFEAQSRFGFETLNCVQFSFLNVLEMLSRYYGKPFDLSDRFLYWASGCTEKGNTYGACYYGFTKYGCSSEGLWAWLVAMSREVYGMEPPDDVKAEALKLFEKWEIKQLHYVPSTVEAFRDALKFGPLWACNMTHSFVIEAIDDRIRTFDTYLGDKGDGSGSFPLDYISNIVAAYIIPFTPKPAPMPNIVLPENTLVTGIFPTEQKTALHVGGKLIVDNPLLVLSQWFARNEEATSHRFMGGPVRTISETDWNSFPHADFKNNPLP